GKGRGAPLHDAHRVRPVRGADLRVRGARGAAGGRLGGDHRAGACLHHREHAPGHAHLHGAVARSVTRPLVGTDLAFGTYESGPADALRPGVELVRAGAEAVKLEGGAEIVPQVRALVDAGIPVVGHLGFTPQSVNSLSGHRVQGRGDAAAEKLVVDALALQGAGAAAVVLELVPAAVAEAVTEALEVPTIGIGAGPRCDGQVLVWQDMAGLSGFHGKFVKAFADLRGQLQAAAEQYRAEVGERRYPGPEHSFD